ncbi:quinone oxidoreductase [Pusillimonas sp. ANT_WB101]|uniref:quinone oxidoreductase family protein n=1 Tax=Pusillimonas sp. ANT_WB101 TaxID=2597356 RepID=UPI0011ECCA71|nr:quinone oxidoreductase [Pusillimonas sp. ANT_WB101]KAA0890860.1 quinone oxidoreductase [Pusillimonas sp. ANT_WB101]
MTVRSRIVQISAHGGPEVLETVHVDVPSPSAGEVRIQQRAIGINFTDIYWRTGLYKRPLPHPLGFEGAGIVESVGAGVDGFKPGDRVAYAQSPIGAYAEVRNVPARQLVRLPDDVGFDEAAALMLKGLTVQYLFRQTYRLTEGETILFHAAAGGVGLIACQWARALGVKLIGTTSSPEKARIAKENGAWEIINYTTENVAERVLELTDGKKLEVVYDGVGQATFETSLDCLQPRGLMINFGSSSGAVTGIDARMLGDKGSLYFTRPVLGTYISTPEALATAAQELFQLVREKKIRASITKRYAFDEIAQAHSDLESRKTTGASVVILY